MFLTESERLQTIKACRDCPMCHPVDLFAQVTGKEANTPRGRGMTLWGLKRDSLLGERGVSGIFYQAFLDGLPQEWCEGNYDFDELVIGARKTLVEKGLSPAVVSEIARRIRETGNLTGSRKKEFPRSWANPLPPLPKSPSSSARPPAPSARKPPSPGQDP